MTTIAEQITSHAKSHPDGLAVTCGSSSLTWQELASGAARMAAHL